MVEKKNNKNLKITNYLTEFNFKYLRILEKIKSFPCEKKILNTSPAYKTRKRKKYIIKNCTN